MGKLVVVSNRLPPLPEKKGAQTRSQEVGGLVSALLSALDQGGGGVWFGWSGKSGPVQDTPSVSWEHGNNRIVGIDLTEREIDAFYNGFCNRALWPLLHSFQARIRITRAENRIYGQVNARFARVLSTLLDPDDTVWVNDYHLMLLGRELRRLGHRGRIGFFLHVPFPSFYTWQILPYPRDFLNAMMEYDLIGFHTQTYRDNYVYTSQRGCGTSWDGTTLTDVGKRQRACIFPIGVDVERFQKAASRVRRGRGLIEMPGQRKVIIGVDRLDYTKGIPQRIQAFETLLRSYAHYRGKVSLYQICAPSRTRVPEYMEQKRAVDALVGRINGEYAEYDWEPVRYLYRSYPQSRLSGFYRDADACLVTPLRDGMNLIAKEFLACQDPEDPGVLVLSRFAGAAEELRDAILVNPYLSEDVAEGIDHALSMSREERVERHGRLMEIIRRHSVEWWFTTFLKELAA